MGLFKHKNISLKGLLQLFGTSDLLLLSVNSSVYALHMHCDSYKQIDGWEEYGDGKHRILYDKVCKLLRG
jgi:hypothetical protein